MSTGLQFDDEMARRIEGIYVSEDAFRRRRAVLDVLELKSDEQILDIGTGPGFLAHEMADAVGQRGAVLAVDFSDSMLGLARTRCLDRQSVRFQKAEATQLPVPDDSFDVAVSVQVYEYVAEVEKALAEVPIQAYDNAIATSLRSVFLSMRFEVPAMLATGGGAIVNMSSTAGLQGIGGLSGYVSAVAKSYCTLRIDKISGHTEPLVLTLVYSRKAEPRIQISR